MTLLRALRFSALILLSFPLSASDFTVPRIGPAAYGQYEARVASNGIDYLVAWRMGPTPAQSSIYTTVARADGSPVAPALSVDASQPGVAYYPQQNSPHGVSVTPGRDGYFVSWVSKEGVTGAITDSLGRVEHRVTVPTANTGSTLAAWNGAGDLVLTTTLGGPFSATLFDTNGDPVASDVPIGDMHGDLYVTVALTADSAGFLVLSTKRFADHEDLYGRRISPSGVPGDWFFIRSITPGVSGLAVTNDGTNDVVAWANMFGIWMMDLDSQTNAAAQARQVTTTAANLRSMIIVNGRIWIAYDDGPNTSVLTIDADGSQTAPVSIGGDVNARIFDAALASNGTNTIFVDSQYDVEPPYSLARAWFITPTSAGPSEDVAKTQTDQEHGTVASGPNQVLAVWDEKLTENRQIFAARSDRSGVLDPAGIQVTDSGNDIAPAAAFNGTTYLVVWAHQTGTYTWEVDGRRVSVAGQVLDSSDIAVGGISAGAVPRIASDGRNWLVVAQRTLTSGNSGVFLTRVSPDGVLLDGSGIQLPQIDGDGQAEPDVAWTGAQYVVAWTSVDIGRYLYRSAIAAAAFSPDLLNVSASKVSQQGDIEWGTVQRVTFSGPRITGSAAGTLVTWQRDTTLITDASAHTTAYEYAFFAGTFHAPVPTANVTRHRVVNINLASSFPGRVVALGTETNGQSYALLQMPDPYWPGHDALWRAAIDANGVAEGPSFLGAFDAGLNATGAIANSAGLHWIVLQKFHVEAGAVRLSMQTW